MTKMQERLPPITLSAADADRLDRLAAAAADKFPRTAGFLAREIARANVVEPPHVPPGIVGMGSTVEYRDDATGETRAVTVVYPDEADLAAGKISVLSPIGTALIGLSVGQSIEWQAPTGSRRSLTVLRADRAGA
jgi:regulator of nucleoside diphosphate kinase